MAPVQWGRRTLPALTREPPLAKRVHGGGSRAACEDLARDSPSVPGSCLPGTEGVVNPELVFDCGPLRRSAEEETAEAGHYHGSEDRVASQNVTRVEDDLSRQRRGIGVDRNALTPDARAP